jgi:hypothetical protein
MPAALGLVAVGLSGCAQPMRADGHMFEHWADAVAAIRVEEGGQPPASAKPADKAQPSPAPNLSTQAAMQIDLIERTALVDAKTAGLREAVSIVDSQVAGLRRQVGLEPASAPRPGEHAAAPRTASADAGFVAQLAAFPSRVAAQAGWARLKAAHPGSLAALKVVFRPVDLGPRGVWVRLQAGAFSTRAEAAALCTRVGVAEKTCVLPVDTAARA